MDTSRSEFTGTKPLTTHSEHCAKAVETEVARMSKSEGRITDNILGTRKHHLTTPHIYMHVLLTGHRQEGSK
jgi:hypothetical protein